MFAQNQNGIGVGAFRWGAGILYMDIPPFAIWIVVFAGVRGWFGHALGSGLCCWGGL